MTTESSPIRVILVVDQPRRDLRSLQRIQDALHHSDQRYQTTLVGHIDLPWAILVLKPHVVVFGRAESYMSDILRCTSGCVVVSLHTEQVHMGGPGAVRDFLEGHPHVRPTATNRVDYFLLANKSIRDTLLPHIPSERLVVVGNVRLYQPRYALKVSRHSERDAIGVACGADYETNSQVFRYIDRMEGNVDMSSDPSPFDSIEQLVAVAVIERAWINRIVDYLRETHELFVRYRFGSSKYLEDERHVTVDRSEAPEELFLRSRVLVFGHSSVALEAMMAGIPAISIIHLLHLGDIVARITAHDLLKYCWQPTSLSSLVEMVDASKTGELPLSPDLDGFHNFVKHVYYNDSPVDTSMKLITDFFREIPLRREASFDHQQHLSWYKTSLLVRILYWTLNKTTSIRLYQVAILYLLVRRHCSPNRFSDVYIPRASFTAMLRGTYPV